MKTTTHTQVTHYEVQKKRRASLIEEWRGYHKTILKRADVVMHDDPHRRMRRGVFAGRDGVKRYAQADIERERRTGTPWYGGWPAKLLASEYPEWQRQFGKSAP